MSAGRMRGILVLALVLCAFLPSLSGGWVWDDHYLLEGNPALTTPVRLWAEDVWGPATGDPSDLYRPLVMSSYLPGQLLWPGPLSARLGNLALHLLGVSLVARLARERGAGPTTAWGVAALFGVHPGVTEAVAWITGRHDLLPAVGMLAAFVLLPTRPLLAGLVCAATALCKEPYILAPLALGLWAWGTGQWSWRAVLVAALGPAAAVGARHFAGVPLPVGAAATEPLASLGALAYRGVELLLWPLSADALPAFVARPVAGGAAVLALLVTAGLAVRGRRGALLVLAPLVLLLPAGPAAAQIGIVGDRYYYLSYAVLAVLVGPWVPERAVRGLALGAVGLALLSGLRVVAWRDDVWLWTASLNRNPDEPRAAFHLAYALHQYRDDCAGAVPLYARAVDVEPRARTNLMACLNELENYEEAARVGPGLAERDSSDPKVPAATARALWSLGRIAEARGWAAEAVRRAGRPADLVLLGNLAGREGDLPAAEAAFRAALAAEPGLVDAERGLATVEAARLAAP